ncbi:MAG: carboxypeptidase-like regulatory domain-containing protein [Deltaproteobacteria bacterium]|nr:carboxypeptidase-like regulatory domain-containing protein [Deltaproteobacteria bacterium]
MSRRFLMLSGFLLVLLLASFPALAQSDNGVISGMVVDRYGKPLKRASVRASNLDDGLTVETFTDEKGVYLVDSMSPGNYEVQASLGMQGILKRQVKLKKGQTLKVDFVFDIREPRAVDPTYRPAPPSLL